MRRLAKQSPASSGLCRLLAACGANIDAAQCDGRR
jgi:hypothetical protein